MYHINKTRGKCCTECKQTILFELSWEEGNEKGGIITKKVKKNPSINLIEKMVDKSTTCGLFGWRPNWAQRFADRRIYMLLFSIIGIVQSMAFSYLTVVLSTIEKRFGLKSKEATWIYSGNEISQIFFILFLPFVGRVQRRPLFMGLSIMLSAVGLLIITLPHFTGEKTYLQINGAQVKKNLILQFFIYSILLAGIFYLSVYLEFLYEQMYNYQTRSAILHFYYNHNISYVAYGLDT